MGIRSFDYFRKLNTDLGETSTITGGLLTIIAFLIVITLTLNECRLFLISEIDYSTVIDNDTAQFINVHVDIIVRAPCQVLSLDQQDEVGVHILDVQDTLTKVRLDSKTRQIVGSFGEGIENYKGSPQELDDVVEAIRQGEQCQFLGFFKVNKVPGNFHISYHAQHALLPKIYSRDPDAYKKMKLDHSINDLHFGDFNSYRKVLKSYPKVFESYMNPWTSINKQSDPAVKQDYEYHMKALPARFYDPQIKAYQTFYKYSINEAQASRAPTEMDSIYFRYQISPVNMVYKPGQKNLYHFLVQLLAIIGGVFAVVGILNQIMQKL